VDEGGIHFLLRDCVVSELLFDASLKAEERLAEMNQLLCVG